jgi:ornithine carbamoyltransferase
MTSSTTTTRWPTHLLRIGDLTCVSLAELLDIAARMKAEPAGWTGALPGRSLAVLLGQPCAGVRVSVETAAHRLGMLPIVLRPDELAPEGGAPIHETARVVSCYATALVAGGMAHDTVRHIARAATAPVINALSDDHDPCQALADLLTLREHFGRLEGLALAYVGDARSVAHSLMEAGALAAMDVRVACPPGSRPALEVRTGADALAAMHGASVTVTDDARAAVAGADAVYTSASASQELVSLAKPTAVVMHRLVARGDEDVPARAVDGARSVARQQAANRLAVQQAAIYALTA